MSDGDVTVEQQGAHIAVVCLHRPPNNYFDTALIDAVAAAYDELNGAGWCRAIVLASEGRHFCAGLDFAANAGQDIAALYRAALRLFAAPLPVVAAVQGAAIGGGCGLALSADFRVATPHTRFSANFSRLGFHHGFALSVTLPAVVGRQAAADLLLTGRRVGGEEALALGLCDRLADDGDLLAQALALCPRAGRGRTVGGAFHPGHAPSGHGRRGPAGHGARVCGAARVPRHGRLRRGGSSRGRAAGSAFQRDMSLAEPGPVVHELNTSFSWADHRGPFRTVTPEQARQYDERGYFVLEGALGPVEVDELTAAIDPFEAHQEEALRSMEGGRFFIARADEITFTTHLVLRSPLLRRFTSSALFAGLCADLIGPDVRLYWDQAVYKKPATESPFPWHQDNGYAFVEPQQYLTCWVALTDATEENGCPWVVPGLHRLGTLAHEYSDIGFVCLQDPVDAVPVPASAGSIVVFSSLTPHSTGPNRTDAVRKAYIVQFAPTGAEVIRPAPGGAATRLAADDESRQFEVLRRGDRVTG